MLETPTVKAWLPFILSASFAIVCLLPNLAEYLDFQLPLAKIIYVPATGLGYLSVFFHEIGHAVASTIFGSPAMPMFDFQHGGGLTHWGEYSIFLQVVFSLLMIAGLIWLYRHNEIRALCVAGFIFLGYLALLLTDGKEIFRLYMGHGTEILIGCFCLFRGLTNTADEGTWSTKGTERHLNIIFGTYALGLNTLNSYFLATDDTVRMAYDMQKGGHMLGDFRRMAEMLGVQLETIAISSLVLTGVMLTATLWAVYYWRTWYGPSLNDRRSF